jgi:hypothetical protein
MNNKSECFTGISKHEKTTLFLSAWISRWDTSSSCLWLPKWIETITECFRLLIWIEFLPKHNVIRNSIQVIPWLTRFLLFQQGRLITYFPHYPCIRFCLLNFPGKFSWKQRISLSSNFPLHAWWGKFRRQKRTSLPLIGELYLIENHRHNYGQYLTTPSRTHSNNH